MEIKDISVSVEQLEEVRGGQYINVTEAAAQLGLNYAASEAHSFGVMNTTSSGVNQVTPQVLTQDANVSAVEVDKDVFSLVNSVFGGFGGYLR